MHLGTYLRYFAFADTDRAILLLPKLLMLLMLLLNFSIYNRCWSCSEPQQQLQLATAEMWMAI